jgi:hypothetical protein
MHFYVYRLTRKPIMNDSTPDDQSSVPADLPRLLQWKGSLRTLKFARYESGETALRILSDNGEWQSTATVSLLPYGAPHPGRLGLWLKTWGGNEGLPEALAAAGVVTLTGRTFPEGFDKAVHAELTQIGRAALAKDIGAARAELTARVYAVIEELEKVCFFTLAKAALLKEHLTPTLIESVLASGLTIGELIEMYNLLLDPPNNQNG